MQKFKIELPLETEKLQALFKSKNRFYDKDISLHSVIAPKIKTVLAINGEWNNWNCSFPIVLGKSELKTSSYEWKGNADLSARIFFNWDVEYLYFGAIVKDNKHFPVKNLYKGKMAFFRGDCIELGLLSKEKHIEFDLGEYMGKAYAEQTIPLFRTLKRVKVFCKYDSAKGVICYQARIPWEKLRIKNPHSGFVLRTALAIPDKDYKHDGSPEKGLKLNDGIWGSKNPSLYGMVTLVKSVPGEIINNINIKAPNFKIISSVNKAKLILKPELTKNRKLKVTGFSKTAQAIGIELFKQKINANIVYKLRANVEAKGSAKVKIIIKWLDDENDDLGAKAALFGFQDNTIVYPVQPGYRAVNISGIAQKQSKKASVLLRISPSELPEKINLIINKITAIP